MLFHNPQPRTLSQVVILDSLLFVSICLVFKLWQRSRYSFRWQGGEVNAYGKEVNAYSSIIKDFCDFLFINYSLAKLEVLKYDLWILFFERLRIVIICL